jgi:hypothetical protein
MRAQEFIVEASEYKTYKNVFPDGDLKLSFHFDKDRRIERDIAMEKILDICHRAATQWPEKISELHDQSFVIQDWDDFGVAIVKREVQNGRSDYVVTTARQDLRIGYDQVIIKLR